LHKYIILAINTQKKRLFILIIKKNGKKKPTENTAGFV
jgi:hypothetical protein